MQRTDLHMSERTGLIAHTYDVAVVIVACDNHLALLKLTKP